MLIPALVTASSTLCAHIDSGGGLATTEQGLNHGSIGASFQTSTSTRGLIDIIYPPLPPLTPDDDTDADNLPDSWEMQHFGSLSAGSSDDPDGDGAANVDEYLAGTDPRSRLSVFSPKLQLWSGKLVVSVPTVSGRSYRVWGKADLNSAWIQQDFIFGDGSVVEWECLTGQSKTYYIRVDIVFSPTD